MSAESTVRPYIGLSTGVVAVSFAAIFIRWADAPPLAIAAYRLTIASVLLAPVVLLTARHELRSLSWPDFRLALLSGAFLGFHFAFWITSLDYTSVASSVVFVTTGPLWVGLGAHLFTDDQLSRGIVAGLIIAVLGGIIIGYGDIGIGSTELLGDLLAIAGAVMVAGYLLIGRTLRPKVSLITYIFLTYGAAALELLIIAILTHQSFTGYTANTYLMFLLLAVAPQLVGHSLFNWALRYLSATYVSVTIMGEPIGSTLLAWFLLNEPPTVFKVIGGALLLAGIWIATREEQKAITEPAAMEL
ncbi:MAG: putative cystine transporter YijE [Anaerolineales bacterium]|nr:putative cystine transporter YijE [Anaerolineales bacterium]